METQEKVNFGQKLGKIALMMWQNNQWGNLQILNRGEYKIPPECPAARFGHGIFDAFKATLNVHGKILIFRLPEHIKRFKKSAEKMGMPVINEQEFHEAILRLTKLYYGNLSEGTYLYFCPQLLNVTDDSMKAFAMTEYALHFVACYVTNATAPLTIKINPNVSRYKETAEIKVSGNYGATVHPKMLADKEDCAGVLFSGDNIIQELETSNFFAVIDGKIYTPMLNGLILPGVTRDSIIQIARNKGYEVVDELLLLSFFMEKLKTGNVSEAWTSGTAVGMSKIENFNYENEFFNLPTHTNTFEKLRTELCKAQRGEIFPEFTSLIPIK